jgi:hypothetical protein
MKGFIGSKVAVVPFRCRDEPVSADGKCTARRLKCCDKVVLLRRAVFESLKTFLNVRCVARKGASFWIPHDESVFGIDFDIDKVVERWGVLGYSSFDGLSRGFLGLAESNT